MATPTGMHSVHIIIIFASIHTNALTYTPGRGKIVPCNVM